VALKKFNPWQKRINTFLLGVLLTATAVGQSPKLDLQEARDTFNSLSFHLGVAIGTMPATEQDAVSKLYLDEGINNLGKALAQLDQQQSEKAKEYAKTALASFRKAGLLMPLYLIRQDAKEKALADYLQAEDKIATAISLLAGGVDPDAFTKPWRAKNNSIWIAYKTAMNFQDATEACKRLSDVGFYKVPTLEELTNNNTESGLAIFQELKDPTKNTVFGQLVSTFQKIWSSTPFENGMNVIDLPALNNKKASLTESNHIICMGLDARNR